MSGAAARWRRLLPLLCALALLAGCGGAPPARRTLTIAWINKTLGNPVFDLGYKGAMRKAAELSAAGPYDVKVFAVGPVSADAVEQARVMDDLIAAGVDGIAVSCNDPTACIDPINRAVESGIPVMTWDSDSPQSRRFTYLGIDNYGAGKTAADLLARAIGGRGEVAILTGVPGGLNLEQRVRGFRDRLAEAHPAVRVVAEVASNEDIPVGVQGVEEAMQAHPELDGWFFAGMWPLVADRNAMKLWSAATRRGMQTVAFDTLPVELDLLRDGYLTALIGQKYWGWGYDSIQIVYDRIVHRRAFPQVIDAGVDIVTPANVEAMRRAWQTNDFSTPLPDPFPARGTP